MERDTFTTPMNASRSGGLSLRSTATKRDSLAAELERDPQLSTAKRQQRAQVFTSSMAHANLERQLVAAQTLKLELETKLREKDLQVERLERDRRWFADREKQEREEKERERTEHEEEKAKADGDLRTLRNTLSTLREEHADLVDAHSSLSRNTAQTIASQKTQITTLTHRASLLEEELAQTRGAAEERSRTIETLQDQFDELSSAQSRFARKGAEEESMNVVREELHRQATYLRSLESTNAKLTSELNMLRERHASVEVLKEEKRGLERKVTLMEQLREKAVKLEAELEAARRERQMWATNAAEASTPSKTPVSVTRNLAELRLTHARLLEEHGATAATLRRREAEIADLEKREEEARQQVATLESDVRALKDKVGRREDRAVLAEREVGFLQALVASFTAEEANEEHAVVDDAKAQRVHQLESLLQEYKDANLQLTQEIDALGGDAASLGHGRTRQELSAEVEQEQQQRLELQKSLEAAAAETKQHLDKIEELEQSLFELGGEIGAGRHVPPGVRILSLKDNPEQQWVDLRQAAMDRLKGENEALMKRLKELEQSGASASSGTGSGEELVPRESWELVNREKTELEDVVKQKEKRLLRLKQVYVSKGAEFRDAIASILGVKLAFFPNGQVRVTSIYDLCASFVFQPRSKSEGATMQLVAQGEGGPQDLPDLMHYWIEKEQCIPGFMASVTLECYENSKRSGGGNSL
ncbi:Spindle assembly checkpoint component mad1 [Hypsizygus marmoreus]|uniref:Spindle assembly checkpoint component MAD1 n=1 Tax=Hypsizygus marmoreus TaxID=39966 RepID=A0A369JGV7_HYPMA|nr:Spindle assembly checkpoint component mad1 [Hypsizygus marmoreus]